MLVCIACGGDFGGKFNDLCKYNSLGIFNWLMLYCIKKYTDQLSISDNQKDNSRVALYIQNFLISFYVKGFSQYFIRNFNSVHFKEMK